MKVYLLSPVLIVLFSCSTPDSSRWATQNYRSTQFPDVYPELIDNPRIVNYWGRPTHSNVAPAVRLQMPSNSINYKTGEALAKRALEQAIVLSQGLMNSNRLVTQEGVYYLNSYLGSDEIFGYKILPAGQYFDQDDFLYTPAAKHFLTKKNRRCLSGWARAPLANGRSFVYVRIVTEE